MVGHIPSPITNRWKRCKTVHKEPQVGGGGSMWSVLPLLVAKMCLQKYINIYDNEYKYFNLPVII